MALDGTFHKTYGIGLLGSPFSRLHINSGTYQNGLTVRNIWS